VVSFFKNTRPAGHKPEDFPELVAAAKRLQALRRAEEEKQFELPVTSLCAYIRDNVEQLDNSGIVVIQKHHNRIMGATNKK
jgi:hypothetical protein